VALKGVNAALRRGLGQQQDEHGRQACAPPGRPDGDRDLGHILTRLPVPGDRHATLGGGVGGH
jgi:hypothetical protein